MQPTHWFGDGYRTVDWSGYSKVQRRTANFEYEYSPNRKGHSGDGAWTCQPVQALFLKTLGWGRFHSLKLERPLPATSNRPAHKQKR